jgi:threonyl-tRNA synthetase
MIHRAILGSFERFIGVLIENYSGRLPLWLAPCQVVISSITSDVNTYVEEVATILKKKGVRVKTDIRNEKISYKVREHSAAKVPVIMVIGKKEAEEKTISVRRLGSDKTTSYALNDIVDEISIEAMSPNSFNS